MPAIHLNITDEAEAKLRAIAVRERRNIRQQAAVLLEQIIEQAEPEPVHTVDTKPVTSPRAAEPDR